MKGTHVLDTIPLTSTCLDRSSQRDDRRGRGGRRDGTPSGLLGTLFLFRWLWLLLLDQRRRRAHQSHAHLLLVGLLPRSRPRNAVGRRGDRRPGPVTGVGGDGGGRGGHQRVPESEDSEAFAQQGRDLREKNGERVGLKHWSRTNRQRGRRRSKYEYVRGEGTHGRIKKEARVEQKKTHARSCCCRRLAKKSNGGSVQNLCVRWLIPSTWELLVLSSNASAVVLNCMQQNECGSGAVVAAEAAVRDREDSSRQAVG